MSETNDPQSTERLQALLTEMQTLAKLHSANIQALEQQQRTMAEQAQIAHNSLLEKFKSLESSQEATIRLAGNLDSSITELQQITVALMNMFDQWSKQLGVQTTQ